MGCGLRVHAKVRNVAARGKVVCPVFVTLWAVGAVVGGRLGGWVYVGALSVMGPTRGFGCGLGVSRSDRVRVCANKQTSRSTTAATLQGCSTHFRFVAHGARITGVPLWCVRFGLVLPGLVRIASVLSKQVMSLCAMRVNPPSRLLVREAHHRRFVLGPSAQPSSARSPRGVRVACEWYVCPAGEWWRRHLCRPRNQIGGRRTCLLHFSGGRRKRGNSLGTRAAAT